MNPVNFLLNEALKETASGAVNIPVLKTGGFSATPVRVD